MTTEATVSASELATQRRISPSRNACRKFSSVGCAGGHIRFVRYSCCVLNAVMATKYSGYSAATATTTIIAWAPASAVRAAGSCRCRLLNVHLDRGAAQPQRDDQRRRNQQEHGHRCRERRRAEREGVVEDVQLEHVGVEVRP